MRLVAKTVALQGCSADMKKLREFYNNFDSPLNVTPPPKIKEYLEREEEEILRLLKEAKAVTVLDVGIGYGKTVSFLGRNEFEVYGIEFSKICFKKAENCIKGMKNVHLHFGDAEEMPFASNFFDAVLCTYNSIGNMSEQVWKEMKRVLKEKGIIVLSLYNKKSYHFRLPFYRKIGFKITKIDSEKGIIDTEQGVYCRDYDKEDISELASRFGFESEFIDLNDISYLAILIRK